MTLSFTTADAVAAPGPAVEAVASFESCDAILEREGNALHRAVLHATPTCQSQLAQTLIDRCDAKTGIVAAALFASGIDGADLVGHCPKQILPAIQQSSKVSPRLRDALVASKDPEAQLVLGTVAKIARDNGDDDLARSIEPQLTDVEAMGNAGCRTCGPALLAAMNDTDPWIRRSAAGALRFVPRAARAICASLEKDADATVREQAAWALGFSTEERSVRVACLSSAAASDPNATVRSTAARSLDAQYLEPGDGSELNP